MKMKTKIIFGAMLPVALFAFGAIGAQAETNSCPTLAPYMCNNGTCVNDTSLCSRTSMGGVSTSNPTTSNTQAPADLSTANLSDKCTGNLRYDEEATRRCAELAEKQGKQLGYDITCTTESRESTKAVNANPVGSETMYFATCKINGSPDGYDPVSLIGYAGNGSGVQVWDNFFGQTTVYGSGYNVNSMWYALPCDLANAAEGKSGVLQGAVTCTKGAQQYFGSSNPSNWRVDTAISKRTGTGTGTGTSGSSQLRTTTTTSNTALSIQIQNMVSLLNKMLEQARSAYGVYVTNTKNSTTTSTTVTTPTNTPRNYLYELTSDKSTYCVGETPRFTITGSKEIVGSKILWSSWLNDKSTNEFDADYGHKLGSGGTGSSWTSLGTTWNSSHIGKWTKQSNINGLLRNVNFEVKDCAPNTTNNSGATQTKPLVCSPSTQTVGKYSVAYLTVADSSNPNFDWSAVYNWSAPGSTKESGAGWGFGTSYATSGTYRVTVSGVNQTATCEVKVY